MMQRTFRKLDSKVEHDFLQSARSTDLSGAAQAGDARWRWDEYEQRRFMVKLPTTGPRPDY